MVRRIIRQIFSLEFVFALFFYLFVASTVSYVVLALVLVAENNLNWAPSVLMRSGVAGMSAGMLIVFFLGKIKMKIFSVHMGAFNLHPINVWFIVIVFGITIWMFTIFIQFSPYLDDVKALVKNSAEGLFAFGTIASIGGLYLAARSIQQYRRQITSFSTFAERLTHMIDETAGDSDEDYVRIMAYTPIPGSLALEERTYENLKERMMKDDARLKIVCLKDEDMSKWFDTFLDKEYRNGKINQQKISAAKDDINHLIERIGKPDSSIKQQFASKHKVVRLEIGQLPNYYFFFNDTRAIVTTPFFFPTPTNLIVSGESQPIEFKHEPVEMIGFETTDAKVVENIKKFYRHRFHN